jgi:ADP-ribose pyrophosphatase YjhB (NUDIX family)
MVLKPSDSNSLPIVERIMSHPDTVVHLEHDGQVLLVNEQGEGPQVPVQGRMETSPMLRLPTQQEIQSMGIEWQKKRTTNINFLNDTFSVQKGYPMIDWPEHWALKDDIIADNAVHPIAREAIYRSIHRLVSKVMITNSKGQVLMGKVERGHFRGSWTLPGGYMDHDEHPEVGCVRETLEELGLNIKLLDDKPIITQQIFSSRGISFVSFTYRSKWDGELSELVLQSEEISEAAWFLPEEAASKAVSHFDVKALNSLR